MAGAYLTSFEAGEILASFGLEDVLVTDGDLSVASDELDSFRGGSFIGIRFDANQVRAFPRSVTLPGETAGEVPERVKIWVALRGMQLTLDEEPAVRSEGAGKVSVTYAGAKESQTSKRMKSLLTPYMNRRVARIV